MLRKVLSRPSLLMRFTLVSFFLMAGIAVILILGIHFEPKVVDMFIKMLERV